MKLAERFWSAVTYLVRFVSNSPATDQSALQYPVLGTSRPFFASDSLGEGFRGNKGHHKGPFFDPPGGWDGDDFKCYYPDMRDWTFCSNETNRGCWLRHSNGTEFNITTDYERYSPKGITRKYTLELSNMTLTPDGMFKREGKVFNGQYPGPWIQACWGDTIEVKVTNNLPFNGTTIHWHGIRQLRTMQMDGVNGVTQCPIAPGDSFVYSFSAIQYGSSWYHSHYSLQYADGLAGPLTIHGPSSANYTEAKRPLLMTDWIHDSAFELFQTELTDGPPNATSMLLNGRGNITQITLGKVRNETAVPEPYSIWFTKGKKYLLRLINTSIESAFVFSIDNHNITIVGADFVPIEPYRDRNSVLVGIGQRYHVIVHAEPKDYGYGSIPADGNYWIRMSFASGCDNTNFSTQGNEYNKIGILRYDKDSHSLPSTGPREPYTRECTHDETPHLVPVVPWKVGRPANGNSWSNGSLSFPEEFDVQFAPLGHGEWTNITRWSLGGNPSTPLWINFSDPTILHLNQSAGMRWNREWVVIPENYTHDSWIYLAITTRLFTFAAHPIHLHGHDFAVVQQSTNPFNVTNINITTNNPPRRDVVILPAGGFVIIAFKADNPGSWLVHCHIAFHASSGLAMQILERQDDANKLWPWTSSTIKETNRVCSNWKKWASNESNWWKPGVNPELQDDSGI